MSSTRRRAAGILTVLALALVPAACGSGSGGGSGDAKPLSKQEYRKRAERISKQFLTDVQRTQTKVATASTQSKRVAALGGFKQAFVSFAARVEKLSPPKAIASAQKRLVAKARESARDIDRVSAAVRAKSASKAAAAQAALREDVAAVAASARTIGAGSR